MSLKRRRGSSKAGRPRAPGDRYPGGRLKPATVPANARVLEMRRQLLGDDGNDLVLGSAPLDVALANGRLSPELHRVGQLLERLYRRAGFAPVGVRAPGARVEDELGRVRALAELDDARLAQAWDRVFDSSPPPVDRERQAEEAMALYRALMGAAPLRSRATVFLVCVHQAWPLEDASRRALEEGLAAMAAELRVRRAVSFEGDPGDRSATRAAT